MVTIPDTWDETLDMLLGQIDELGPEQIEKARAEDARRWQRDRAMAVAIRLTFRSKHGQKTLGWLAHHTIRRQALTFAELMALPEDQRVATMAFRAGEDAIFNMLIEAIGQANATEGGSDDD